MLDDQSIFCELPTQSHFQMIHQGFLMRFELVLGKFLAFSSALMHEEEKGFSLHFSKNQAFLINVLKPL